MGAEVEVRAAGGVVLRERSGGGVEVAVVHRPKYDDWSLPKGKLEPDESWEEAALREVEEETGVRCELVRELDSARYFDSKGRRKLVRFWLMRPVAQAEFVPGKEIDELRWLAPSDAIVLLSYQGDRELVSSALP